MIDVVNDLSQNQVCQCQSAAESAELDAFDEAGTERIESTGQTR